MHFFFTTYCLNSNSNSNWTEWSTIQGVIAQVISKLDKRKARARFEITSTITPGIGHPRDLCTDTVISLYRGRFYIRCAKNSLLYREYRYIEDRYIGVLYHTFYCNF